MPSTPDYTVRELSEETWPDFEKLFSRGNGWDFCWCIHFQRPRSLPSDQWLRTRVERGRRNRREKKELLVGGRAHGILVYAENDPVGWCQYGRSEELPRFDNSRNYPHAGAVPVPYYAEKTLTGNARHQRGDLLPLWRISCFVVDKKHRRRGVASIALRAALQTIKAKGGGLVQAFPLMDWKQVCRERERRCGHLPAFGNSSTHGTLSMFEREGFKVVAPYGAMNVLVQKTV